MDIVDLLPLLVQPESDVVEVISDDHDSEELSEKHVLRENPQSVCGICYCFGYF
jgi:hypothetical protein